MSDDGGSIEDKEHVTETTVAEEGTNPSASTGHFSSAIRYDDSTKTTTVGDMDTALRNLLRDFHILERPGMAEITHIVELTTFSALLRVIDYEPDDWARLLGKMASKFKESTFLLSRLKFMKRLVDFLRKNSSEEGRTFTVTKQDKSTFRVESRNPLQIELWARDLDAAIRSFDNRKEQARGLLKANRQSSILDDDDAEQHPLSRMNHSSILYDIDEEAQSFSILDLTHIDLPGDISPGNNISPESIEAVTETVSSMVINREEQENDENRVEGSWKRNITFVFFLACLVLLSFLIMQKVVADGVWFGDSEPPSHYANTESWIPQLNPPITGKVEKGVEFGFSVSMSENALPIVAIGAPKEGIGGVVHIYKLNLENSTYSAYGKPLEGTFPGSNFGFATAISDDGQILVVGANGTENGRGQVQVYKYYSDEGLWKPRGQPLYGASTGDNFGNAVSLSATGRRLAVGALQANVDGVGVDTGAVYVFDYKDDNEENEEWEQIAAIPGNKGHAKFGFSVALSGSGDVLAVGAPYYDVVGNLGSFKWGGQVRVFLLDDRASWSPLGNPLPYESMGERYGWSIDLSSEGFVIAAGAPLNADNGEASGQVRVYTYDGKKDWVLKGQIIQGQNLGRWFAGTVHLLYDGNTVATSLWCNKPNKEPCSYGGVRVFRYSADRWTQLGGDVPGSTLFDPHSMSIDMKKDGTIIMSGTDENSVEVVQAYKLPPGA